MNTPETVAARTTPPETIRALDQNGNEVLVPREQWASEILPNMLRAAWDNPDQLYFLIINSLNEGFLNEVTPAAQHLSQTDPIPARGVCVWGATLTALDRLVEAEMLLSAFPEENASVLVNLAKVYQAKGEHARAEATLHRALAADPNEDNALGWLAGLASERAQNQLAGLAHQSAQAAEAAVTAEILRIAADPRSWRAQLWLARQALAKGDSRHALQLYAEALAHAPQPIPPELLVQLSGELGNHGLLDDLIALATPHFVPEFHGLQVGNNLVKANADRGHLSAAAAIVHSLLALNQPDWTQPLAFWQNELARLSGQPVTDSPQQNQIQIGMVRIDGPVWLPAGSPAHSSFPAKSPQAPTVTFLGGSAESPEDDANTPETAAALGQLTRALPLFLAEQTQMRTAAAARTILPWAVSPPAEAGQPGAGNQPSGFIVAGQPWPDATAVQAATQADATRPTDLVVTVHLDAEVTPWEASLVFLRTSDATRIGELSAEFSPEASSEPILTLAGEMVDLLGVLGPAQSSPAYTLPPDLSAYLAALERLLTLRCATMPAAPIPTPETRQAILAAARQLATSGTQPATLHLTEIQSALNQLPE